MDENELKIKAQHKPVGLHKLLTKGGALRVSANARILNENYMQGFCLNTLDQLIDILNKKCGLILSPNFLKDTKLSLAHIKNDIELEPEKLLNELMLIGYWSKYQRVRRENSITYENTNKTSRQSTIIYSKHTEMILNKSKYKGLAIDHKSFKGITRIETHFNDWKTVKNFFGTRNLEYILNQKNVNNIMLKNILKGQPDKIKKTDLCQFKSLNDEKDYFYIKSLNERFNGNVDAIKAHIRTKTKNPKHQYNKIDKYLPMTKAPKGYELNAIKEMKTKLMTN